MHISAHFDSGNIEVINSDDKNNIQLAIRPDVGGEFFQWFNFLIQGQVGEHYVLNIVNAGGASYLEGWESYQAVASFDRDYWFRLPTSYKDGTLTIEADMEYETIQIAYFAPYSYERHLDLLASVQLHPLVTLEHLGETLDKRDLTVVKLAMVIVISAVSGLQRVSIQAKPWLNGWSMD